MILSTTFLLFLGITAAYSHCPPVKGDLFINVQDLYAESADWDPQTCRLYLSSSYNTSIVIFDPIANSSEIIKIPGLSKNSNSTFVEYHTNGIDYDPYSGNIWMAAASAVAFTTTDTGDYSKADFTGPNRVFEFNPRTKEFVKDYDFVSTQEAYLKRTGQRTSGFQDIAETPNGDSFAIGTFGNSIVRLPRNSNKPELWYVPEKYNKTYGFGGIFSVGSKLVVSDTVSGGLVTFDTRSRRVEPTYVPLQGLPSNYRPLMADGLLAPAKYRGKIALWSDDFNGTSIYRSDDDWKTAKYLGLVLNDSPLAEGGFAVATVEIGESIYVLTDFFQFELPVTPRATFPLFDITEEVERIVRKSGLAYE